MKELIVLCEPSCNISAIPQKSDSNTPARKIIALQGKEGVGKTATLKKLIQKIDAVGTCIAQEKQWGARMKNSRWDACAVFEYKGSYIAITTRGDAEKFIAEDFDAMDAVAKKKNISIDVYICAIHTSGKTVNYVNTKAASIGAELYIYGKATYGCTSLSKPQLENKQSQINNCQAQAIFDSL